MIKFLSKVSSLMMVAALLGACQSKEAQDVDRQINLLDQIQPLVTVTFEDQGPTKTKTEGRWRSYRFRFSNEFRNSVWIEQLGPTIRDVVLKQDDTLEALNPQAYCYQIEVKSKYWEERGNFMGGPPHHFIEVPAGTSVEFTGIFRVDRPDIHDPTDVRGVMTVYCDPTDINGRHIVSPPLPFPK